MNSDIDFKKWRNEINNYVKNEINIDIEDLPDQNYRIFFDNGNLSSRSVSFIILGDFFKYVEEEFEFLKNMDNNI